MNSLWPRAHLSYVVHLSSLFRDATISAWFFLWKRSVTSLLVPRGQVAAFAFIFLNGLITLLFVWLQDAPGIIWVAGLQILQCAAFVLTGIITRRCKRGLGRRDQFHQVVAILVRHLTCIVTFDPANPTFSSYIASRSITVGVVLTPASPGFAFLFAMIDLGLAPLTAAVLGLELSHGALVRNAACHVAVIFTAHAVQLNIQLLFSLFVLPYIRIISVRFRCAHHRCSLVNRGRGASRLRRVTREVSHRDETDASSLPNYADDTAFLEFQPATTALSATYSVKGDAPVAIGAESGKR